MSKQQWKGGALLAPVPSVLVSSSNGEKDNIITIGWTGICATHPPKLYISIRPERFSYNLIKESGEFNVSVLTEETPFSVFQNFGFRSGRTEEKFEGFQSKERSSNYIYYVTDYANAYISANVVNMIDCGTHMMIIGEVVDAKILSDKPSVTYDYYFKNIKPKPEKKSKGYVCKICGYVYEGDPLPEDFICPWCKHPASDFEKIE